MCFSLFVEKLGDASNLQPTKRGDLMDAYRWNVRPTGFKENVLTRCALPLRYLALGAFDEKPCKTFFWNTTKLGGNKLNIGLMLKCDGVPGEVLSDSFFRFLPLLGGWTNYVVLKPVVEKSIKRWHLGWGTKKAL